jgi:hypothetical protein
MANINGTGIEVRSQINNEIPIYAELNLGSDIYYYYLRNMVLISIRLFYFTIQRGRDNVSNHRQDTICKIQPQGS